MIELFVIMMAANMEAEKARMEREKKWIEDFLAASPEMKTIMFASKRKAESEEKIERRHRERVQAQKEIADAIRYAARPGRHFFDF
jgi:hypothetical protein